MSNGKRFDNKHVVITGAARGIGFEIAKQFGAEGAVLSLIDYHKENLSKAAKQLSNAGMLVYAYAIDVSSKQAVTETIAKADGIKPLDILINNAGIAFETPFLDMKYKTSAEWRQPKAAPPDRPLDAQ